MLFFNKLRARSTGYARPETDFVTAEIESGYWLEAGIAEYVTPARTEGSFDILISDCEPFKSIDLGEK